MRHVSTMSALTIDCLVFLEVSRHSEFIREALLLLSSMPESWKILVVSLSNSAPNGKLTMSMVMDALFNEEAQRRKMGTTDQKGHFKRNCPKYKAHDQSSNTAATTMMADEDESDVLLVVSADEKSDWVLDLGSVYHLCRDREGELLSDMGLVVLARRMDKGSNHCTKKSGQTRVVQPVQDVQREAQRKETKSILKSCITMGAATSKRVPFALDLINGGDLSSCVHKRGEIESRQLAK
ncbi:hypothetical protein Acr_00g0020680 [Actinidia rufa]|uniref:Uncharacterized protein n=1 Tax=Actinidia rufa TaxID=165716 RepID=A0A7J0DCC8_9ERIC|nr:hypothetical protein Acr_00g0020680 [Actinidia rufa]